MSPHSGRWSSLCIKGWRLPERDIGLHLNCAFLAATRQSHSSSLAFSFPEAALLLVSTKNRDLWEGPTPEDRNSRTSRLCAHAQSHIWRFDWLKMRNEISAHAPKIGPSEMSRFLVLAKRSTASIWGREWILSALINRRYEPIKIDPAMESLLVSWSLSVEQEGAEIRGSRLPRYSTSISNTVITRLDRSWGTYECCAA